MNAFKFLLIIFVVLCLQETKGRGQARRAFSVYDRFSFSPTNHGIFLPVSLQGKEYLFLLDTGTSWMVYDETFRAVLGPAIRRGRVKGTTLQLAAGYAEPAGQRGTARLGSACEARNWKVAPAHPGPQNVPHLLSTRSSHLGHGTMQCVAQGDSLSYCSGQQ